MSRVPELLKELRQEIRNTSEEELEADVAALEKEPVDVNNSPTFADGAKQEIVFHHGRMAERKYRQGYQAGYDAGIDDIRRLIDVQRLSTGRAWQRCHSFSRHALDKWKRGKPEIGQAPPKVRK